jgi:hypothetical protein
MNDENSWISEGDPDTCISHGAGGGITSEGAGEV